MVSINDVWQHRIRDVSRETALAPIRLLSWIFQLFTAISQHQVNLIPFQQCTN